MRADLRERPVPAAEAPARPARPGASVHELDLGALRSIAGFHMARASVPALDAFERHVGAPHALHKVEFSLLMLLQANPAVSPKALARALAIAAPKLTALLDRLQQRGLLQRRPNPNDGRSQLVDLTAQGQRLAGDQVEPSRPRPEGDRPPDQAGPTPAQALATYSPERVSTLTVSPSSMNRGT